MSAEMTEKLEDLEYVYLTLILLHLCLSANRNDWPKYINSDRYLQCIYCCFLHSAWSESSEARLTQRGGHRTGEKLGAGAFATLNRRGPKDQGEILGWLFGGGRAESRSPLGGAECGCKP